MKTVKLTKAQLRRIIREARFPTGDHGRDDPRFAHQQGSDADFWRSTVPQTETGPQTEAEIDWVQVGPMEVLRMGRDTVTVLDWDASGADDMVTVWHNGKMKKVRKSDLSPL